MSASPLQRWMLGAASAACLILTIRLLPGDPLLARQVQAAENRLHPDASVTFDPDAAAKFDIPMNTDLPTVGAGAEIRAKAGRSNRGYLVVGLGTCASCMRFDFERWEQQSRARGIKLVGFSGATPENLKEFKKNNRVRMPVYFDPPNGLAPAINSYWNGRVYYFDAHWKLKWRMQGAGNNQTLEESRDLLATIGRSTS